MAVGEDEGDVLVVDGPRDLLQGALDPPQGVHVLIMKEPLVVVAVNPGAGGIQIIVRFLDSF